MPELLDAAVRLLERAEVLGILPPAGQLVRMGYFAWRRFFGGCPALIRISLFLVAKAVLVGQNDPDRAFLTRIFKSTGAL